MTVKELIEELKAFPDDAKIVCMPDDTICTVLCNEPISLYDDADYTYKTSKTWYIYDKAD